MKRLVLSEGRRDVQLVEIFYEAIDADVRVDTFYGEDVTYEQLKNIESDKIRNFLERRNPYDVLAKSENGKPDLKRVFMKLIKSLVDRGVVVTLLIDLDGESLDTLFGDLDTRVQDNYQGNEFGVREVDRVDRSSEMIAAVAELYSRPDGEQYGDFDVIAFHEDLETSAEIDESEDNPIEKLRDFVGDERATIPMRSVLL